MSDTLPHAFLPLFTFCNSLIARHIATLHPADELPPIAVLGVKGVFTMTQFDPHQNDASRHACASVIAALAHLTAAEQLAYICHGWMSKDKRLEPIVAPDRRECVLVLLEERGESFQVCYPISRTSDGVRIAGEPEVIVARHPNANRADLGCFAGMLARTEIHPRALDVAAHLLALQPAAFH